jgi:D-alanyl-D-alanine carboxypeptidase
MAALGLGVRLGIAVSLLLAGGCTTNEDGTARHTGSGGVATSAVTTSFPKPATTDLPGSKAQALQGILAGVVGDYGITHAAGAPGITAAIVSDRGSWAGAAGRDGEGATLTPDAMMSVAGITRTFVAAEVMKLANRRKVDLDASMSTYVRHPLTANHATVRQTLSMRSGLVDPPHAAFEALNAAQLATPVRRWTAAESLAFLRPRSSSPGGPPVDANANYLLLGMLIEKVTGKTVAQVERADLFTPSGLSRIAAQDSERPPPPLAAPPRNLKTPRDGYLPSRSAARVGADSISGIAADAATVARWGYQLYGGRLLPAESVRAMTSQPSVENIAPGIGYGLGTMVFPGLGTETAYGHLGQDAGYSALMAVVPARHLAVAVLIPESDRPTELIARDLLAALRQTAP